MYSKLSDHKFKNGKFITQFGEFMKEHGQEHNWFLDRLPQYIWLALILHHHGREKGMTLCAKILKDIQIIAPNVCLPKMSELLSLDKDIQRTIYGRIAETVSTEVIAPMTFFLTHSKYPCFAEYFTPSGISIENRLKILNEILECASDHQSNVSTDIRYLVIYFQSAKGLLTMSNEIAELFSQYPRMSHDDPQMRLIRPLIRSIEVAEPNTEDDMNFCRLFWEEISILNDCQLVYLKYDNSATNIDECMSVLKKVMLYYAEMLKSIMPTDNKLVVLLGVSTFAYKRILEIVEHNLYNTISGRSDTRSIIECFLLMKYLLHEEAAHKDIWSEYQYYGIGQYKLVVEKVLESKKDIGESHVNIDYLDALVQDYKNKEFIEMNTSYFGKINIRAKAKIVNEMELYGFYYDYDSAYEHALWGAIRESCLLKCNSPSHQYHCVPDIENTQKLPNVWHDCWDNMYKIVMLLREHYGMPEYLYNEVMQSGQ